METWPGQATLGPHEPSHLHPGKLRHLVDWLIAGGGGGQEETAQAPSVPETLGRVWCSHFCQSRPKGTLPGRRHLQSRTHSAASFLPSRLQAQRKSDL